MSAGRCYAGFAGKTKINPQSIDIALALPTLGPQPRVILSPEGHSQKLFYNELKVFLAMETYFEGRPQQEGTEGDRREMLGVGC